MTILITGASGLVGNTLFHLLKQQGHLVFGVARTNRYGIDHNFECADLTNSAVTEQLVKDIQPDVIFHLAANASESRGQISPIDMVQRNVALSTNVLRSSINNGVRKFIFASSISVYGDAPTPYKESSVPEPKDVYGVNKLAFEQILKIMAKVYKFDYTIFRPHNIYGPGQNMADTSKNVVALFMRRLLEKKPYALYGEGEMRRAFTYVDDIADIFAQGLTKFSKQTVNVGSSNDISIKELSSLLQDISSITVPVEMKPCRPQEMADFVSDHTLQDLHISYSHTSMIEGLVKTWNWVKNQPLPEPIIVKDEIYV